MENKRLNKKRLILIISITAIVCILAVIIFLCCIKFESNVYKGIFLNDKEVSGYTPKMISEEVTSLSQKIKDLEIEIYQENEKIYTVSADMIDLKVDINKTVNNILDFGHTGQLFQDITDIFQARKNPKYYTIELEYSDDKMQTLLKNIDLTLKNRVVYDTYYVSDESLILIKGKDGYKVDFEETANNIIDKYRLLNESTLNLNLINDSSASLNANDIMQDVSRSAKDAYIDETVKPAKFVKEVEGLKISEESIQNGIDELEDKIYGENVEKTIEVIKPNVYLSDIYYDVYNDKLASFTTYFAGNVANRAKNIEIASSYINDKVVMPGEIFSFNENVGEITSAKGYLMAATFSGGKVVDGLGGGVCQVSSTLYNTALLANLEIVERYAHSLPVSYVLPSRDATIFVGVLDFKFKNTRTYPIKIVTSYSSTGMLTISIYGTKEEREYDIDIESHVIEEIKPKTEYITDSSLAKGTEEVVQGGTSGAISEAYIIKKYGGVEVERKLLSKDVYSCVNKIVKVNK